MTFPPVLREIRVNGKKVQTPFYLPKPHIEHFMYHIPNLEYVHHCIGDASGLIGDPRTARKFKETFHDVLPTDDPNVVCLAGTS
jgi:hypothetical protein